VDLLFQIPILNKQREAVEVEDVDVEAAAVEDVEAAAVAAVAEEVGAPAADTKPKS
jgi:hypothetical protein